MAKNAAAPGLAMRAALPVRGPWREQALDQDPAPDGNVCLAGSDAMVAVGLSPEMDEEFRKGPGAWRDH